VAERFLIKKSSFYDPFIFLCSCYQNSALSGAIFYPQTPPSLLSKISPPSQQNIELYWNLRTIYGG
jgi:hypothetical protein